MAGDRPLSDSERRRFEELSQQLTRDDPRFTRRLPAASSIRQQAVLTAVLSVIGAVVLVVGLVVTATSVVAGVVFALAGLILLAFSGWRVLQFRRKPPALPDAPQRVIEHE